MSLEDRRNREITEMRNLILNAAKDIISNEGIEKLSIRKIAKKIEYSPSIIYHYFKDKDDIVTQLTLEGYKKITDIISKATIHSDDPKIILENMTKSYINAALKMPDEFLAMNLSTSPNILKHTSTLFKGASEKKPALKMLSNCIKEIYNNDNNSKINNDYIELTSQIIATATLGIITKLILEKDIISNEQKEEIINHFVKTVVNGMIIK